MKITIETKDGEKQEIDAYGLIMAAQVNEDRDTTSAFIMEDNADERDLMMILTGIIHRVMLHVGEDRGQMAAEVAIKAAIQSIRQGTPNKQ